MTILNLDYYCFQCLDPDDNVSEDDFSLVYEQGSCGSKVILKVGTILLELTRRRLLIG